MCVSVATTAAGKMSTKQAVKRKVNKDAKSEIASKKMKPLPVENNNVEDHHDDVQVLLANATAEKACKLPDEVLQKFYNEPGHVLIAGNVAWDSAGKIPINAGAGERNELMVFHRLTNEKVRAHFFRCICTEHTLIFNCVFIFSIEQFSVVRHPPTMC